VFIDYRLKGCVNWENQKNNITGSKKQISDFKTSRIVSYTLVSIAGYCLK
jgi:hypothetical protein